MKNIVMYVLTLVFFLSGVGFIMYKYASDKKQQSAVYYGLKERKAIASDSKEWVLTRKRADYLENVIKKNPDNLNSKIALSGLFIQEARITGDYLYYDKAAMKYVDDVLQRDPGNFEAMCLKALLHLSQHHFAQGLQVAEKAKAINPHNAFVYGILVDAHTELGNYKEAVENSDMMVSIRPDLRSYSRISYLREIHGDYQGAIEAMELAVDAGVAGDESTEWCRVQLGNLYQKTGVPDSAEMQYRISLEERPGYAYAFAGMAKIAIAKKDFATAARYYDSASARIDASAFKQEIIEMYRLAGDVAKADRLSKHFINEMVAISMKAQKDETIGHYADHELAIAFLNNNDLENALKYAMLDYNMRPLNIDANETLAWIYFNRKDYEKATHHLEAAMKTNSQNPVLLCRAALIYSETGKQREAQEIFSRVLSKKILIPEDVDKRSRLAMQNLHTSEVPSRD